MFRPIVPIRCGGRLIVSIRFASKGKKFLAKEVISPVIIPRLLELFEVYKNIHGSLAIRKNFIIPADKLWPEWSVNCRLGFIAKELRTLYQIPTTPTGVNIKRTLDNIEFVWDNNKFRNALLLNALRIYKQQRGKYLFAGFIVPKNDSHWPRAAWGLQLGPIMKSIAYHGLHQDILPEIKKIGVVLGSKDSRFDIVKQALTEYKLAYGNLLVPAKYIIPKDDPQFSPHLHGKKLGWVVINIRAGRTFTAHREELTQLGFEFHFQDMEAEKLKTAIRQYQGIYGDVKIPSQYVIPAIQGFDVSSHGMKLGKMLTNLRFNGTYVDHHEAFIQLGIKIHLSVLKKSDTDESAKHNPIPVTVSSSSAAATISTTTVNSNASISRSKQTKPTNQDDKKQEKPKKVIKASKISEDAKIEGQQVIAKETKNAESKAEVGKRIGNGAKKDSPMKKTQNPPK